MINNTRLRRLFSALQYGTQTALLHNDWMKFLFPLLSGTHLPCPLSYTLPQFAVIPLNLPMVAFIKTKICVAAFMWVTNCYDHTQVPYNLSLLLSCILQLPVIASICVTTLCYSIYIVTCSPTRHGVWKGNCVYWTLISRYYRQF